MKKLLSIFLVMLMLCSAGTIAFAAGDAEIIAEGSCGTTVNWKLDGSGQLTIYGSGSMQNYWYTESQRPSYEPYKNQITSLVIEEGVTAIGKYAFYNFQNITGKLVFPNSMKSIWSNAFEGCEGLTEAPQFNDTLNDIEFAAFRFCKNMKGDLVIPDSVTNLGIQAFSTCSSLDGTLYIGRNVQQLHGGVFYDCSKLTGNLLIPDSVQSVNGSAFYRCKGFDGSLYIGHSVTKIEPLAFAYCENLKGDLIIPDRVTEIGSGAFYFCEGFNGRLKLSKKLERIYEETYEPGAFQGCSGLTGDLELPETLTCIGKKAFYDCYNLTGTLKIPESVATIGKDAFHGCAKNTDLMQFFSKHPEYVTMEERTTEPTCRVNGFQYYTAKCADCGSVLKTWNERLDPAHKLTEVPYAASTEEIDGNILHYTCSVCGNLYLNKAGTEGTTSSAIILHYADVPKIENSEEESESQPASFELVTYCKHDDTELDRKTVTLEMHPAVEASLLGDGNVKYYTGDDGNKYVYDEEKATFEATENVTVPFVPIAVEKLNVNEAELHLVIGDTFQLETTTEPANATFPQVIFTSSDESVAEVNPLGLVTGKAEGMATIECRTGDGATATVTVTVKHKHISGEPRIENISKQPTCAETGSGDLVTRCVICEEELARETDVVIPATGKHTPDGGHKEKEVNATCETEGSYVFVIRCKDCGKELSAETVNTGYADHDWNDGEVKSGKYDKYTVTDYTCQHCGQHKTEQTRNPDYQFRCKQCDWYDARRNTKGVLSLIYKMIHDITHMVQHINFLT